MIRQGKYFLEVAGEHIPYELRRSRRAKNLLLHVELDGSVELVVPWHAPFREGLAFIRERSAWLLEQRRHQASRRSQVASLHLTSGALLPVFGETVVLTIEVDEQRQKSHHREREGYLYIRAPRPDRVKSCVETWYRKRAVQFFTQQTASLIKKIEHSPIRIRVNSAKTQWGSCNKQTQTLTFNWRLALAPPEAASYVAVHEVAHLVHSNHSRGFWNLVRKLEPNFESHRTWLRTYGHTLSW